MIYDFHVLKRIADTKQELQRLIDMPYKEWTARDHWLNKNKPFYIGDSILVDIIERQVVVITQEK